MEAKKQQKQGVSKSTKRITKEGRRYDVTGDSMNG